VLLVRACLVSAFLVLAGARGLQQFGLIGPNGVSLALAWSDRLTRRGMRAWRGPKGRRRLL
jgi:hypothetical protein